MELPFSARLRRDRPTAATKTENAGHEAGATPPDDVKTPNKQAHPKKARQLSAGNIALAAFWPNFLNWKNMAAMFVGLYATHNVTAAALPGIDEAAKRYDVSEEVLRVPGQNMRFRFGGEASSLHALTDTFNIPISLLVHQSHKRPGSDYVVGDGPFAYLDEHLTKLCAVSSKTNPANAHQSFARIAGIDPEHAAILLQGREKAWALFTLLHETRHCDPYNKSLQGVAREADSDMYALGVMKSLKNYPDIEDLVLTARSRDTEETHDSALMLASHVLQGPQPTAREAAEARALMDDWARPYAAPGASISQDFAGVARNNPEQGAMLRGALGRGLLYGLISMPESSTQAYLRAWHDHRFNRPTAADQRAFDRLEMLLGANKTLLPDTFRMFEDRTGVTFSPLSKGYLADIKPYSAHRRNAPMPARPS